VSEPGFREQGRADHPQAERCRLRQHRPASRAAKPLLSQPVSRTPSSLPLPLPWLAPTWRGRMPACAPWLSSTNANSPTCASVRPGGRGRYRGAGGQRGPCAAEGCGLSSRGRGREGCAPAGQPHTQAFPTPDHGHALHGSPRLRAPLSSISPPQRPPPGPHPRPALSAAACERRAPRPPPARP
jgi:hypothetical protein